MDKKNVFTIETNDYKIFYWHGRYLVEDWYGTLIWRIRTTWDLTIHIFIAMKCWYCIVN